MTCNITGTAISPDGQVRRGATINFIRTPIDVVGQDIGFVVPDKMSVKTSSTGEVDFDILPGVYIGSLVPAGLDAGVSFGFSVPDQTSADFADCLNDAYIELKPASVAQAEAARDIAIDARDDAVASAASATSASDVAVAARDGAELAEDGAQAAQVAAEAARDTAFVNANVYANTAAGLAAVALGGQFTVVSEPNAVRYREDAGPVATEVARFPTSASINSLERRVATLAGSGVYKEPLWRAELISWNQTAGTAATYTKVPSGDFTQITPSAVSTDGAIYTHTTGIIIGGARTRIRQVVNAITVFGANANSKVGIALDDGTAITCFVVEASVGVIRKQVVGGASETLATSGSTFADGDVIDIIFDINHVTEEVQVGYSVNGGPRYWAGFTGPSGDLSLLICNWSRYTYSHRLEFEAVPLILPPVPRQPSLASIAALFARDEPPGWAPTRALPSDFEVYHYNGNFATSYDDYPSPLSETDYCAVIYVDAAAGSDAADGSRDAPLQSLRVACLAARYARHALIMAKPGDYTTRDLALDSDFKNLTTAIVPWGIGRIKSAARWPGLVWTLNTGATWQATITGVTGTFVTVRDAANLTAAGDYSRLTSRGSIALVDANPGSYHVSGTTIYVRTTDGRQPDADLHVYDTFRGTIQNTTDGVLMYLRGIDQEGSQRFVSNNPPLPHTQVATAVLVDCTAKYNTINAVWGYTYGATVSVGCEWAENLNDGASYGIISGSGAHLAIEVNLVSRNNGSVSNDQNSTMHTAGTIVRVNGTYTGQAGQGIADVGSGWSWLLGCVAAPGSVDNVAYFSGGQMWLDTCSATGGAVDRFADAGATIRVSNFTGTGTTGGTGTHASYTA